MIGYYLIFFLLLQNVDNGLDGNDQTLTPGQKIRTSKKKVQQLEAQVAQLKNSRYPALLSLCIFFLNIMIYILLFWTGEGGFRKVTRSLLLLCQVVPIRNVLRKL